MPRIKKSLFVDLSAADLRRMLAARERVDVLEKERQELSRALAKVEKELRDLLASVSGVGSARPKRGPGRPRGKKKTARKSAGSARKKTAKKVTKKTAKKPTKKGVKKAAKRTPKKKIAKASAKKAGKTTGRKKSPVVKSSGKPRLEDVIVAVIKKHGKPMPYQDLLAAILKGKLFKTKSKNFDNVLRRTLSTSKRVKRAGRGVYAVA